MILSLPKPNLFERLAMQIIGGSVQQESASKYAISAEKAAEHQREILATIREIQEQEEASWGES